MKRTGLTALVTAGGVVVALAGCSSPKAGETVAEESAAVLSGEDLLSTAGQNVTQLTSLSQDFPAPTEAFDAGTGTAAVVAGGFAAPVHAQQAQVLQDAVDTMGWNVLGPFDGQFSPAVQGGFIDQAVQQDADAILLYSIDVSTVQASVDQALAAGISVACVMCTSGQEARDAGVIDATTDFEQQGEALGWYLIDKSQGDADVVITYEPASNAVVARTTGLERVLDQCADCSYQELTIPAGDSTLPGPPQWTGFLSGANSDGVTDVVAYYDGLVPAMVQTLADVGREDVVVSSYDADPSVVSLLDQGNDTLGADVASPIDYASWSAVDLVARQTAGVELWDATALPAVLITADNVGSYTPPLQPEGDWKAAFAALWTMD